MTTATPSLTTLTNTPKRSLPYEVCPFGGLPFPTFTSNLLSYGAAPKDVQELLGHLNVNTAMNIYAHATREAKRSSARLLGKVARNG